MPKILFIEDEIVAGSVYSIHLKAAGYDVSRVSNGNEGLSKIKQLQPDLVILDLMLPGINGIQLLQMIRSARETANLPVIVLTSSFDPETAEIALKAGANKYLIKSTTTVNRLIANILMVLGATAKQRAASTVIPSHAEKQHTPPNPKADFMASAPKDLDALSANCWRLLDAKTEQDITNLLTDTHRKSHALTAKAALASAKLFADFSSAVETMLKELCDNPRWANSSSVRTIQGAIELLILIFTRNPKETVASEFHQFETMIVDDELLSRKVAASSLDRVGLRSILAENAIQALDQIQSRHLDLVITDIDMPGMDGIEFCRRMRRDPKHNDTPIIFLTSMDTFDTRMRSTRSGGDDFIGKPVRCMELAVKALTQILNTRLKTKHTPFQALSR